MYHVGRLVNFIDTIGKWTGRILGPVIVIILAMVVYQVLMRYAFGSPTSWAILSTTYLFGVYFILGGGTALLYRRHVNMDIFYNRWTQRTKAIVDMTSSVFFFGFCSVLLWQGWQVFWESLQMMEHHHIIRYFPLYPVRLMVPVGAVLILLQGFAKFMRDCTLALTDRELP